MSADSDLEHAIALMAKHRALEDTIQRARHYGAIAKDALALFPASPMKQALEEAVEFCIARSQLIAERRRPHPPISDDARAALRAAALAARAESNKPKQVAPEPDMRASRQPGSARKAASTSAMTGCNGDRRRFEIVAVAGQTRRSIPSCRVCRIGAVVVRGLRHLPWLMAQSAQTRPWSAPPRPD